MVSFRPLDSYDPYSYFYYSILFVPFKVVINTAY